jgi:Lon protease-like protein
MGASFVLPLYPLEDAVLLPGATLRTRPPLGWFTKVVGRARDFGDAVVTSLVDGDSVHEVGVTAILESADGCRPALRGVARCRLLELVDGSSHLVRVERFPEPAPSRARAHALARLLQRCYLKLCARIGQAPRSAVASSEELTPLTWLVTGGLGLTPDEQQGFLNVPDALTRGRLLLLAVRELERRERFLRPWAHLRTECGWN